MGGRGGSSSGGGYTDDPKHQDQTSSRRIREAVDNADSTEEKTSLLVEWIEENISTETETVINEITSEEYECYKITIDGIIIYFESPNDAAVSAIKALISENKIPDLLKEHIDSIMIIPDINPGNPLTIAAMYEGQITIFQDRIVDAAIIAHETAHILAEAIWGQVSPPQGSNYRAAIDSGEPPVSTYGGTSPIEDFAEAVRMYVAQKAKFKKKWPRRYAVIHRLMNNRNYNG